MKKNMDTGDNGGRSNPARRPRFDCSENTGYFRQSYGIYTNCCSFDEAETGDAPVSPKGQAKHKIRHAQ